MHAGGALREQKNPKYRAGAHEVLAGLCGETEQGSLGHHSGALRRGAALRRAPCQAGLLPISVTRGHTFRKRPRGFRNG